MPEHTEPTVPDPTRRPRVLLSAYACVPGSGSEAGVGWSRALETAKWCDTWVLCEAHWAQAAISEYLERHGPLPGLTFVFVPKSWLERRLTKLGFLYYLAYNLWQRRAARVGRELQDTIGFDLVHQATLCGYREPGYLWRLGVPFVWGPVGGTQNVPWRFLTTLGVVGAIRESVRGAANALQLRFSGRVRRVTTRSAAVLTANSTARRDLRRAHGVAGRLLLETGLSARPGHLRQREAGRPLRLLWSGEHRAFKALPLLLDALAHVRDSVPFDLRILGSGPRTHVWRRHAERLGLTESTEWLGWMPHEAALEQCLWADVFVFTSLRDTSGNAALEALQSGAPVICLDHQGMGDIVTDDCGVRIAVTTPRRVVADLGVALESVSRSPGLLERLSQGALDRAETYRWPRQMRRTLDVYREILARQLADRRITFGLDSADGGASADGPLDQRRQVVGEDAA